MARQRFIWPDIWKDPVFGKLQPVEQVMFIGLFSIADDAGRTLADSAYLRSELFAYKDYTNKKVQTIRDAVVEKADNVHLYRANGFDYIALLKWHEYQKPKYPKDSKIPAPFLPASPILPPTLPEDSPKASAPGRAGQDRVGLGRAGQEREVSDTGEDEAGEQPADFKIIDPVARLLVAMTDRDDGTEREVRKLVARYHLGEGDLEEAREAAQSPSARSPVKVGMSVLQVRGEQKSAA